MTILIAGGGSVGYIIAEYFSREGHNVTVIEPRRERIVRLQEELDVTVVDGWATDIETLRASGIDSADIFLALTDDDEANIIACNLAKYSLVPKKVARLSKQFTGSQQNGVMLRDLGVDQIIDTEDTIVQEVVDLLKYPGTADVKKFFDGDYTVAVFNFRKTSPYYGKKLGDMSVSVPFRPLAISQVSQLSSYQPDQEINEFLYLYVACESKYFTTLHKEFLPDVSPVKKVMIYGGGYKADDTSLRLVEALRKISITDITLVHEDENAAQVLSTHTDVPVVFGDPSAARFRRLEHFGSQDAFIALSSNFEKNFFASVLAYQQGINETISLVRDPEHVNVISSIPLTSFLSPALVTANKILCLHKADSFVSRTILNYEQLECLDLILNEKATMVGKKISDLKLTISSVVAIMRRGSLLADLTDAKFEVGDRVLLFVSEEEKAVIRQLS